MAEDKPSEATGGRLRTCKRCGQAFAALSILFVVTRRARERRHEREAEKQHHHRFPIFGH